MRPHIGPPPPPPRTPTTAGNVAGSSNRPRIGARAVHHSWSGKAVRRSASANSSALQAAPSTWPARMLTAASSSDAGPGDTVDRGELVVVAGDDARAQNGADHCELQQPGVTGDACEPHAPDPVSRRRRLDHRVERHARRPNRPRGWGERCASEPTRRESGLGTTHCAAGPIRPTLVHLGPQSSSRRSWPTGHVPRIASWKSPSKTSSRRQ